MEKKKKTSKSAVPVKGKSRNAIKAKPAVIKKQKKSPAKKTVRKVASKKPSKGSRKLVSAVEKIVQNIQKKTGEKEKKLSQASSPAPLENKVEAPAMPAAQGVSGLTPENFDKAAVAPVQEKPSSGEEVKQPDNSGVAILEVPAMPLANVVLYPYTLSPLVINDANAMKLVENAASGDRVIAFFPEMPLVNGSPARLAEGIEFKAGSFTMGGRHLSAIGTIGRIVKLLKFPDNTVRVLVRGIARFKYLQTVAVSQACVTVKGERLAPIKDNSIETAALVRNATKQFKEVINFSPNFPEELKIAILNMTDNERVVDLMADTLNISYAEKLAVLSIEKLQERLHLLTILLNREVEVLRLGSEIQNQVHNAMSKSQREFFLREQLKQIKSELGEGNVNPDIVSINSRLAKTDMPEETRAVIKKEVERLDMIPQASSEYNIAYTYVDWLLSIPWNVFTKDTLDVNKASEILDRDHYGLKDVKKRILEFLSVIQLRKSRKAPIVCFVGPPGVGKTSLGKSIAEAMGRKFVRISLGGVRDEAEIRGHRRTYIGALPGRIIQGMKKAGSSNPVFMLDEIDKLGSDYHGDPASALLEVLDPQQNSAFNDHYLEVDYDLSSVMFIATANIEDTIPGPLRDRMEIIRLPGYTPMEKHEIARRYLVPRQMRENGLLADDVRFTRSGLDEIIAHYTMEAGVRNLERTVGTVCRRIARNIVERKTERGAKTLVNAKEVVALLGPEKIITDEAESEPRVGVATGMAWTSVGGATLQVEATKMPGRGELKLTGSLGNVMKESAMTAFSLVRSRASKLGIPEKAFKNSDFHIHVPDGATPKDGPSAGVTLVTALVSLLTGRPVRPHLSMTGEITLLGRVSAIGGVKEKVIAAMRFGIKDVIMPKANKKDLEEVPDEVKNEITFHFVDDVSQVLAFAVPARLPKERKVPSARKAKKDEIYVCTPLAEETSEQVKKTGSPNVTVNAVKSISFTINNSAFAKYAKTKEAPDGKDEKKNEPAKEPVKKQEDAKAAVKEKAKEPVKKQEDEKKTVKEKTKMEKKDKGKK